jgi:hypothetical protein
LCGLRSRPIVALRYLKVVESPLQILDGLDGLRMRNDLTRIPLLSSLGATSRMSQKKIQVRQGCTYSDPFLVCMHVSLTRQSVFRKVLLGSRHVYDCILHTLLVRLPFLPCALERSFRLCKGCSRLLEFLFDVLQSALKGFVLGLQTTSECS